MSPTSEELAAEQAYFDHAHKHRERRRALLGDAPAAAANPGAAKRLLAWMKRKESARPQQEAVAFGRIDDESLESLYIGYEVIADEDHQILVINWKTPAA